MFQKKAIIIFLLDPVQNDKPPTVSSKDNHVDTRPPTVQICFCMSRLTWPHSGHIEYQNKTNWMPRSCHLFDPGPCRLFLCHKKT